MTRTAVDTSVVVAALLPWHEHHEPAAKCLRALLENAHELILPATMLIEAYSVMTRLPAPHRLAAQDARDILERNFRRTAHLVSLSVDQIWNLLDELAVNSISGGAAYDGVILDCARRAGSASILTFNRRDFERLSLGEIEIRVPGE
jgi:predicted nucleic acid-binding protein